MRAGQDKALKVNPQTLVQLKMQPAIPRLRAQENGIVWPNSVGRYRRCRELGMHHTPRQGRLSPELPLQSFSTKQ